MNIRVLIRLALGVQVLSFAFWLFYCPGVESELKIARDELRNGNADLPTLTYRRSGAGDTTVAYDPSKSASENLVARATLRLSIADDGYLSLVRISVVITLLNAILLIAILVSSSHRPNKRGAGKGGFAVLWRAGRACPALPDRDR